MATTVTIGGADATDVQVASATSLTCVVPPGTGVADVVVTTTGGSATADDAYTYQPAGVLPTLDAASPTTVPTGVESTITVTGTGLAQIRNVDDATLQYTLILTNWLGSTDPFWVQPALVTVVSDTELTYGPWYWSALPGAGPWQIGITDNAADPYEILALCPDEINTAAAVQQVDPATAPVGVEVELTLTGQRLDEFTGWGVALDPDPDSPDVDLPQEGQVLTGTVGEVAETTATFTVTLPTEGTYNIVATGSDGEIAVAGVDMVVGESGE